MTRNSLSDFTGWDERSLPSSALCRNSSIFKSGALIFFELIKNIISFFKVMVLSLFLLSFFRNDILTEELECQLTTSVTSKKEDNSDSDLDLD